MSKIKLAVSIVVAFLSFAYAIGTAQNSWGKEDLMAPSFTLNNLQGQSVSLADSKGNIILINFWATWCKDCVQEMPEFEKLYQKYQGKGLSVFAISIDKKGQAAVETFFKKKDLKLTFPILLDSDGKVARAYRVAWVPVTIVIGRNGKIMETVLGARPWGSEKVMKSFDRLLKSTK